MNEDFWALEKEGCKVSQENLRPGVDFRGACMSSKLSELGGFESPKFKTFVLSKFGSAKVCSRDFRVVDRGGDRTSWWFEAACS